MVEYVKGIALFLIFSEYIGIILPNPKYKQYYNLVLGLILILIIIKPLIDLYISLSGNPNILQQWDFYNLSFDNIHSLYERGGQ